ncbi:PHP domain-containing protein [Thalassolituus sp.]|uniref:PHP domain-containing protein n=1 Tax=Thalassolituus sp. TaxID=2030822 RepID=UPI002A7F0A1D|nr:PHP domain-containing protein [Thalassolituus sp.]
MNSEIDLHCHSTASDGKLSAPDVVSRAAERGVKILAITDHDTVEGFRLGREKAAEVGIQLISGIELSCVWGGITIHIVGLNFDPESDVMREAEAAQTVARESRSVLIAERVGKRIKQTFDLDAVREYAGGEAIGRPHFAQYMIDQGWVPNMAVAFNKYLGAGKPGDVKASWPELAQATEWIVAAGGTAVMAHAHLYKMTRTKLKACLQDFKDAGGQGLEVAYGNMDANQLGQMSALAREMDLLGSCGSDFHGPNRFGLDLGVMPTFPKDVTPVWASWS